MKLGPELTFVGRTEVLIDGERRAFFGGNDYHRLSNHPAVVAALADAARQYGINAAGSRLTTANHPLYRELESRLAEYLGAEAALVVSAGYLSNETLLQALTGSTFFVDEAAHPSLMDAALACGEVVTFRHCDAADLAGKQPGYVLTDGVFASTGEMPPLAEYAATGATLIVDDAHAVATVGVTGKGSWEKCGVPRSAVLQTGTLSKGIGAFGGFVAGSRAVIDAVAAKSNAFVGSTPMPLPMAAAAIKSLEILTGDPRMIARLRGRTTSLKRALRANGFALPDTPAPILSLTYRDEAKNRRLGEAFTRHGVHVPFIHYPGCPPGGHFRLTLSSEHTDKQLERLYEALGL